MMINFMRATVSQISRARNKYLKARKIKKFLKGGKTPWSPGYLEYRDKCIEAALENKTEVFTNLGKGLDERIIEIPWVFRQLSNTYEKVLDAGSSLNHPYLLDHPVIKGMDLTICTYHPEHYAKYQQRISYLYADLRDLPLKDSWFDKVVCISTLEHINMDNAMYGYNSEATTDKSFSYLKAVSEMNRVLRGGGSMFITVPFGKFENHGFFQQFDKDMVSRISDLLELDGKIDTTFYKYSLNGWNRSSLTECEQEESFNPHTGIGKKTDGAAHSRAICCISFYKK